MAVTPETVNITREVPGTDEERTDSVSVHDIHRLPAHVRKRAQYNLGQRVTLVLMTVGLLAFLSFMLVTGGAVALPAGASAPIVALWGLSKLINFVWVHYFLMLADYCERER